MKISKIFFISTIVASSLFANSNDLIKEAKDAGLIPLPSSKAKLEELIEKSAPDSKEFKTTKERVELGKMLYFDPRLSKSSIISCNTCHNVGLGGVDGISSSIGHKWTMNPHHINAPTVYNSVFNSVQFWDGRAAHLAAQAAGPATSEAEMASSPKLIEDRISSIPEYVELFKKAYGKDTKVSFDLITTSIGIFERTLVTPSKYDDFLNGDKSALNDEQKEGLKLFIDKGCAGCHNGVNLGGTMQPFEVAQKYEFSNVGDFKGDKDGMVKTPVLRNIKLTYPYFHNGEVWDINKAIKMMGSIQLGINISDEEANKISKFFDSLTGKMPKIEYPILPASTLQTPRPDDK